MSDLIRKEDAIEAYSDIYWIDDRLNLAFQEELDKIDERIRNIPTVEVADRPQGEWEIVGKNHPYKRCPFCKRVRAFTDTRFCDWCGARMKGADDETD